MRSKRAIYLSELDKTKRELERRTEQLQAQIACTRQIERKLVVAREENARMREILTDLAFAPEAEMKQRAKQAIQALSL